MGLWRNGFVKFVSGFCVLDEVLDVDIWIGSGE